MFSFGIKNDLCPVSFWDLRERWNKHEELLTPCSLQTIITVLPCLLVTLVSSVEVWLDWNRYKPSLWSRAGYCRYYTTIILIWIQPLHWLILSSNEDLIPSIPVSLLLRMLSYAIMSRILLMNREKGVVSSGSVWTFALLQTLAALINCFHGLIIYLFGLIFMLSSHYKLSLTISVFEFTVTLIFFYCCWFADVPQDKEDDRSPRELASFPSRVLFWWVIPVAKLACTKTLSLRELFKLRREDKAGTVTPRFIKTWKREGSKAGIMSCMVKAFGVDLLIGSLLKLCEDIAIVLSPLLLKWLLNFIRSKEEPSWHGFVIVLVMFLVSNAQTLFGAARMDQTIITGLKVRSALTSMIYQKAFRLQNSVRRNTSIGQIVNFMSEDADQVRDMFSWFNALWSCPFQIFFSVYLIYQELGIFATFTGVVITVAIIPLNTWALKLAQGLQIERQKYMDDRMNVLTEVLSGIKVIKLYAWEESFMKVISRIRDNELKCLTRLCHYYSVQSIIPSIGSFLVALVSFTIFLLTSDSKIMNADQIFVPLICFNMLQNPINLLSHQIRSKFRTSIAVDRLDKYLKSEEIQDYVGRSESQDAAVSFSNASFSWDNERNPRSQTLSNISIDIKSGSLTAVVGVVGSGKSSFLSTILGEIDKTSGDVTLGRDVNKVAYVSQQAWIKNDSVKENILFGIPYDHEKYQRVLEACQLLPDLDILPAGDETEIGEKGINLSGGQKQRIELARACFSDADLYLLDDPLSAVDSNVAKNLYQEVLSSKTGVLRNKTRILVTNNLTLLPLVDEVIVLKDGSVTETGSYQTLMENKGEFADFVEQFAKESIRGKKQTKEDSTQPDKTVDKSEKMVSGKTLIDEEEVKKGKVKASVYLHYIQKMSMIWLCLFVVGFFGGQVMRAASNYSLSLISSKETSESRVKIIVCYAVFGLLQPFLILISSVGLTKACLRASQQLHQDMLVRVFRSPMSFFETTPLGRIINRFSKDVSGVDTEIRDTLSGLMSRLFQLVAAVVMISSVTPTFLFMVIPISIIYYFIQKLYNPVSRQMRRMESVTRSPIFSFFAESLSGVKTIRAYAANNRFVQELEKKIDTNLSCYHITLASNRWLAICIQFCGSLIIASSALFAVLSRHVLDVGLIGLSLSYASNITILLEMLLRETSDIENDVVSVERILEYTSLESEAEWETTNTDIVKNGWPKQGRIDFENYSTRYRPGLDLVLRNLNLTIYPGERIGVVGRTGAGKSSISLSLMRIIEAASGCIRIDDIDISQVGLHDLRRSVTLIPQDPILYSGSLRSNLDPFQETTDEQIWESLSQVNLKEFIEEQNQGLDLKVSEGGDNFSVGQKQIICLARALLRKTRILILDEATASVDMETDSLVQSMIRTQFSDCTIIVIAHRLHSILDSDRVLVLSEGEVAEFDDPKTLLSNESSLFSGLAKSADQLTK